MGTQLEINCTDLAGCTDLTPICQLWIDDKPKNSHNVNCSE